jgi:hypothetical protein
VLGTFRLLSFRFSPSSLSFIEEVFCGVTTNDVIKLISDVRCHDDLIFISSLKSPSDKISRELAFTF